jgi:hypothetical protein
MPARKTGRPGASRERHETPEERRPMTPEEMVEKECREQGIPLDVSEAPVTAAKITAILARSRRRRMADAASRMERELELPPRKS